MEVMLLMESKYEHTITTDYGTAILLKAIHKDTSIMITYSTDKGTYYDISWIKGR